MKLLQSEFGRKIKMQFWLSDWSGHHAILDELEKSNASMSEVGIEAMALLTSQKTGQEIESTPHRVTRDMQQIMAQATKMQALALEIMAKALAGQLSPETGISYTEQLDTIKETMLVIEGAGNYGSALLEVEDDEFGDW